MTIFSSLLNSAYDMKARFDRLNETEKKLVVTHPIDAYRVLDAAEDAKEETVDTFGRSINDDVSDAFRHCRWQQLSAERVGVSRAEEFGDAHEMNTDNTEQAHAMDFFNNAIGRGLAGEGDRACHDALDAGDLQILVN